jgi:hypothetical protein
MLAEVGLDLDHAYIEATSVLGDLDHCLGRICDLVTDLQ